MFPSTVPKRCTFLADLGEQLVLNRGPLSALIHPNTEDEGEEERNHTQRATWMGAALPLDLTLFKKMAEMRAADQA